MAEAENGIKVEEDRKVHQKKKYNKCLLKNMVDANKGESHEKKDIPSRLRLKEGSLSPGSYNYSLPYLDPICQLKCNSKSMRID